MIFYHLEKCGGTSALENARIFFGKNAILDIAELISPLSENAPTDQLFANKDTIFDGVRKYNFVHDPYLFIPPTEFPEYEKIIILRKPEQRYLSYANMILNYNDADLKIMPERLKNIYQNLINLKDDDVEAAQKIVKFEFLHDQFRILDPHYTLDLNDFDKIFFLERYHEFDSWLLDWCGSTRKSIPTFNEGKQKKFRNKNLVIVPQEDRLLYLHAKMINRLQCMRPPEVLIKKFIKRFLGESLKPHNPLIESNDCAVHGDFFALEDNIYGKARWLGSDDLVLIPCPQADLFNLIRSQCQLKFTIANMAYPESLQYLEGYICIQNGERSFVIKLDYQYDTKNTPFTITFTRSEHLGDFSGGNLTLFIVHRPIKLKDGRVTSVQLAGGHFLS